MSLTSDLWLAERRANCNARMTRARAKLDQYPDLLTAKRHPMFGITLRAWVIKQMDTGQVALQGLACYVVELELERQGIVSTQGHRSSGGYTIIGARK